MHGFIPPDRFFSYLTWTDIQAMPDQENVVIIQPVGAIEQHGPHLPIIVDSAIAVAVLGKALAKLDPSVPAYVLPLLSFGVWHPCWGCGNQPGKINKESWKPLIYKSFQLIKGGNYRGVTLSGRNVGLSFVLPN